MPNPLPETDRNVPLKEKTVSPASAKDAPKKNETKLPDADAPSPQPQKKIYIIAGCNGAGKTTASFTILTRYMHCEEFINADEIARGLSPFHPESVPIEAGKLMIQRIGDLMKRGVTFAVETTLSTRSYVNLIRRAHKAGYQVELIFLWLSSPDVAVQRVAHRVMEGGHNIPEDVIRRRYSAGIKNLVEVYSSIVDRWILIDNNAASVVVAETVNGQTTVFDLRRYNKIFSHNG